MRRRLPVFAGLAVLLIVGSFLAWTFWEKHAFDARIEKLRAAGEPVAWEDLVEPPVHDDQSAIPVLEEAAAWLDTHRKGHLEQELDGLRDRDLCDTVLDEERQQLSAYLESLGPYFEILERIPARPAGRVRLTWERGFEMETPAIPWLQDVVRYLCARVELDRVDEGRTGRAARTAVLLLEIADRCDVPYVIGHLVLHMVREHAAAVLARARHKPGFDVGRFRQRVDDRLAHAVRATGPPPDLLRAERVFFISYARKWMNGEPVGDQEDRIERSLVWRPFLYRDARRMLLRIENTIAACDVSPEQSCTLATTLQAEAEGTSAAYRLSRMYLNVARHHFRSYTKSTAVLRLARVAMALMEYRETEGMWPASLAMLGEMPPDPFSGRSFRYELRGEGARVGAAAGLSPGGPLDEIDWDILEHGYLAWTWDWPADES